MLPLELFSPTMTRVAHFTPHAWAVGGFGELAYRGGSVGDVLGRIGVLSAYAAVLLAVSGWRLRQVITSGS
jgi:ABC-2 type transport system permease protein